MRKGTLLRGALLVPSDDAAANGRARRAAGDVLIRGRRIVEVGAEARRAARRDGARTVDLSGCFLAPGFVDLHTHGAAGVDFVSASAAELDRAMDHYASHGVTSLLLSVYPSTWRESLDVLDRLAGYLESGGGRGMPIGIHLEGPFLSPARPGALPRRRFRACSLRDARRLLDAAHGHVRTMTIAPELDGAAELIRFVRSRGVVAAFGHSDADYATTRKALGRGVRYATHLFNAMRGVHHRDPGAVTALLEDPEVDVELIADGHHVSVPVLRLVHRAKPRERIILVSDSVHPCGLRDGRYAFAGAHVTLENGVIRQDDGTLAGSALTLDRAVALQVEQVGVTLDDAVRFAATNPARAIGRERSRGRIRRGRRADLVALDGRLRVRATWVAGELVHGRLPELVESANDGRRRRAQRPRSRR